MEGPQLQGTVWQAEGICPGHDVNKLEERRVIISDFVV